MQKYKESDIKPFQFTEITDAQSGASQSFQAFSFQSIEAEPYNTVRTSQETIRQERDFEKQTDFKIDGVVREYRGLSRQEQDDFEKRIQVEVEKRTKAAYEKAYQEGLNLGREEGKAESLKKLGGNVSEKVDELNEIIIQVKDHSARILEKNQNEIYDFVKRFTKWIVLKEINEKAYLENLLSKLILELNARKNLIIKVGKANFSEMPEVVAAVESKLGQLSNVRIEIVPELNHPGIILESENGLIDGSLEGVFQNIDKIFETVVRGE